MKKVCFFIGNMSHAGGTERVLSIIAGGLAQRGCSVAILSLHGGGPSFFAVEDSVRIYWVEEEAPGRGILSDLRALNHILDREQPDFLVDVDIILCFYSVLLKRRPGMHWISWEHFNYYYHFRRNHNLRRVARRVVARYSEQIVVLSEEDKAYYRRNLMLRGGLTRIYNPNPYENVPEKKTERPMIFAAGRLTGVKGFDLLLESWKFLEQKYPDWTVIVAGDGEEKERLEAEREKLGLSAIHFIGKTGQIETYYQEAAFFVLPSRDEGFGMVLLEAMAFGIPVVSYSCKAGPAEIVTDGQNGFLIVPGDTEAFAEKMELLMKDEKLRREMGRQARESTTRFRKEKILDDWEALLDEMLFVR